MNCLSRECDSRVTAHLQMLLWQANLRQPELQRRRLWVAVTTSSEQHSKQAATGEFNPLIGCVNRNNQAQVHYRQLSSQTYHLSPRPSLLLISLRAIKIAIARVRKARNNCHRHSSLIMNNRPKKQNKRIPHLLTGCVYSHPQASPIRIIRER